MNNFSTPYYPVNSAPSKISALIWELHNNHEAPEAMIGSCVIAALSTAISYKVDVERFAGIVTPTSVNTWVIAGSGSRKTSIERQIMKVFNDFEKEAAELLEDQIAERSAAITIWNAKYERLKKALRSEVPKDAEQELKRLLLVKPTPLFSPRFFYKDATIEAIKSGLRRWPCGILSFAEGGSFLSSRAISNQAFFNEAWDGSDIVVDRATEESFVVTDPRLTLAVMVQEKTFFDFLDGKGRFADDNGFFSRFLISFPTSLEGRRFNNSQTGSTVHLDSFNKRLREILMNWLPVGGKHPQRTLLKLSTDANEKLRRFSNNVESDMGPNGFLSDLRAHGSKAGEHAVRLAALFHYFEDSRGHISGQTMTSAIEFASWHLHEAKRLLGSKPQQPLEVIDASSVEMTIRNYLAIRPGQNYVPKSYLFSHCSKPLRNKARLDMALQILVRQQRITMFRKNNTMYVIANAQYFQLINQFNGTPISNLYTQQSAWTKHDYQVISSSNTAIPAN